MADSTTVENNPNESINVLVDDLMDDYCKHHVQSALPREFRTKLHKLFARIEREFEREYQKVYAENYSYQERLEKLEEPDHFDVNNIVKRSASQLSQKIKQQYKQSTSKIVSSLRQSALSSISNTDQSDNGLSILNKTLSPRTINSIGNSQNHRCSHQFTKKWMAHKDGIWEVKSFKNFIASCSLDKTVKIWSNDEFVNCLLTYTGHVGSVNSIRFRDKDHLMLTSSGDGSAHLIRLPTQELQSAQLAAQSSDYHEYISAIKAASLAINSDVSGSCQQQFIHTNCVNLENNFSDDFGLTDMNESPIKSPNTLSSLIIKRPRLIYQSVSIPSDTMEHDQIDSSPLVAADFISSRDQIVTAGWDRIGRIYDLSTGQEASTLSGHDHHISDVRCAPNGEHVILTSSRDGTFRIWDLRSHRAEMHVKQAHSNWVSSAQFVPGNPLYRIISCGRDKFCRYWDIRNTRNNSVIFARSLSSPIYRFDISYGSPKLMINQSGNKSLPCAYYTEDSVQHQALSSFNSKMNVIALPLDNQEIRFLDMQGNRIGRLTRNQNFEHSRIITSAAWSEEGKSNFLASSFDATASLWNVTFSG